VGGLRAGYMARVAMISRARQLILPFTLSAVGIGWGLHQIDWHAIPEAFSHWNMSGFGMAIMGLCVGYTARICRWQLILVRLGGAFPLGQTAAIYLGSIGLNNFLPMRAGDIARVVWLTRANAVGVMRGTASVVLERVLDAAGLAAIMLLVMPVAEPSVWFAAAVLSASCGVILALPWWFPLARRLANVFFRMLPLPTLRKLWEGFADSLEGALRTLRNPAIGALLVLLTGVVWCAEALVFAGALISLGVVWPLSQVLLLTAVATLSTILPSAPGYLGTFHAAVIWCGRSFGLEPTTAAVLAMVAHMMLWLPMSVVGVASLAWLPPLRADGQHGSVSNV